MKVIVSHSYDINILIYKIIIIKIPYVCDNMRHCANGNVATHGWAQHALPAASYKHFANVNKKKKPYACHFLHGFLCFFPALLCVTVQVVKYS